MILYFQVVHFPQLTKEGNGKVGVDADSPVDVGEEAEGIHVLSIHLCLANWVHFLRQRWGTE